MLLTIKIPIAGIEDDLRLVQQELAASENGTYIPVLVLRYALEALRGLRSHDTIGLNPAAAIDAALLCRTVAMREGRAAASSTDMREAVREVVMSSASDKDNAAAKLAQAFPEMQAFMQRNLPGIDIAGIAQQFRKCLGIHACTGARVRQWITSGRAPDGLCVLTGWIARHETMRRYLIHDVTAVYCAACIENHEEGGFEPEIRL